MKKILLPLEETDRSLKTLNYVKKHYTPEDAEFVLMMVDERLGYSVKSEVENAALSELNDKLKLMSATLEGYKVGTFAAVGKAGLRITRAVREVGADLVVMTKSSKPDMLNSIGTTAEYVINNSSCDVLIVSESSNARNEYRGLVYKTAKGTVNLRGQLGDKQSECLLPSINQDCIYIIEVTVGKVRFFHTAYNPDTRNWDLPPTPGQEVTLDIAAGERKDILVKADSTDGKADRIRIVNRDMKKEAVFNFKIVAADGYVPEEPEQKSETAKAMESRATIEMPRVTPADEIPADFEAPEVPTFVPESMPAVPAAEAAPVAETEAAPAPETAVEAGFEPAAEPEMPAVSGPVPAPAEEIVASVAEAEAATAPEPAAEPEMPAVSEPVPAPVEEIVAPVFEAEPAPAAEPIPVPTPVEEITAPVFEAEPAPAAEPIPVPAPVEEIVAPVFEAEPAPAAELISVSAPVEEMAAPVTEAEPAPVVESIAVSVFEAAPAPVAEAEPEAEAAATPVVVEIKPEPMPAAEPEAPAVEEPAPASVVFEELIQEEPKPAEEEDSGALFSVEIH